jgi:dihydrofolate reductase
LGTVSTSKFENGFAMSPGGRPMRKLIESTHVSLGGEIGSPQWAFPYLNDEHNDYAERLLFAADALLLGRLTYEGLSAAYPTMTGGDSGASNDFIDRMNSIPKYVASTTLREATWNGIVIDEDVASFVADLKQQPGGNIVKYGNGPLDVTLMEHGLIDEFHLLITPVAIGRGQHLFESVDTAPALELVDVTRFSNGVVILTYTPT